MANVVTEPGYGLTQRENGVLEQLLLGRDAPSIAEEFVISVNTVKTHAKRIYTKNGVHSRQELADLVAGIEGSMRLGSQDRSLVASGTAEREKDR